MQPSTLQYKSVKWVPCALDVRFVIEARAMMSISMGFCSFFIVYIKLICDPLASSVTRVTHLSTLAATKAGSLSSINLASSEI